MNELGSTDQQSTGDGHRGSASARGSWQQGAPYPAPQQGAWGSADGPPGPRYAGPRGPVEQYHQPYRRPYAPPNAGSPYGALPYGGPPPNAGGPNVRQSYAPNTPYGGAKHPGWSGADPQSAGSPHAGLPQRGPLAHPGPQHPTSQGGANPGVGPMRPNGPGGPVTPPGAVAADASTRPRRRGRVGRWIGAAVVVAALGGVGWYVTFGAPSPVTAAVGDCVSQTGENDVAVVGCGEPSAQFRVAGRVEGKTMIAASLFACSDFPDATSSFWQGVQDKPGTVLCLAPLHP